MNEQRPFDPQEAIENAQRLDMLRLQNEQTNLLRQMAENSGSPQPMDSLERKLGMRRSDNPEEFKRRIWEQYRKDMKTTMKWMLPLFGGLLVLLFITQFL